MPTTPPYTDPSFDTTYTDPQYTAVAGALDTELGTTVSGIETSYARRRSDRVRSYQDALDNIQYGMREAGIGLREDYAQRGLYNAGGDVSGVGQLTATRVLDPLLRQARTTSENYASDIAGLEEQRTSDINQTRASYGTRKTDLANQIYQSLRGAARQRFEDTRTQEQIDYERGREAKADMLKDPTSRLYNEAAGRTYIGTPAELKRLTKKYGSDAIVRIGGRAYLRPLEERLSIQKERASISGSSAPKKQTTAELNRAFNADINAFNGRVQTRSGGAGDLSREQIIDALAEDYPHKSRGDIAKEVYAAYPDNYR